MKPTVGQRWIYLNNEYNYFIIEIQENHTKQNLIGKVIFSLCNQYKIGEVSGTWSILWNYIPYIPVGWKPLKNQNSYEI